MKQLLILLMLNCFVFAGGNLNKIIPDNQITIQSALALRLKGMNRRSVSQKDVIEKLLVKGEWKTPQAGMTIRDGEEIFTWENIDADSNGWFNSQALRSGYAYAEIESDREKTMLLQAMAYTMVYVNGEPRNGNVYLFSEDRNPWEPEFNYSYLPVKLKKGKNKFLFQVYYGRMKAVLHEVRSDAVLNEIDLTLPDIRLGEQSDFFGGVIIANTSDSKADELMIRSSGKHFVTCETDVPMIQPMSTRKVKFNFKPDNIKSKGDKNLKLEIINKSSGSVVDSKLIKIRVLDKSETYRRTFISNIDGSVQYYAINPSRDKSDQEQALFLSLHGANVEGLNQANSYFSKSWGIVASPTNRRPFGFNWEDWGRLDALEVFGILNEKFKIDRNRIYLTGHSMGGHGTWHIGATFPDRFAAIGPSAGWISFWSYRYRDVKKSDSPVIDLIDRTGNPSDTYSLARNYSQLGVYIIHGSADNNVRASQAHSMIDTLKNFHEDYVYHEEPDAGHWWDYNDEDGADCVDWQPLFDFFARHARPTKERIKHIQFVTASPGISAVNNWATIYLQERYFEFSNIDIKYEPGKQRIIGTTHNVAILALETCMLDQEKNLQVLLDGQELRDIKIKGQDKVWLKKADKKWSIISRPDLKQKGPHRYGSFKDAFRNNMVFVLATGGSDEEDKMLFDKVRYDAEQFWYQGNGAVEIVQDKDFSLEDYKDRNIILYGNSETNSAWDKLLSQCPVSVDSDEVKIGSKKISGNDIVLLLTYPRNDSKLASVAAVAYTGREGLLLSVKRPYLKPGFTYPDFTVINSEILDGKESGYKAAGFFGDDWELESGEIKFFEE